MKLIICHGFKIIYGIALCSVVFISYHPIISFFDHVKIVQDYSIDHLDCSTQANLDCRTILSILGYRSTVKEKINNMDFIFYEDDTCFYVISVVKHPWNGLWSSYAKNHGLCIRKADGYILLRAIDLWEPSGFVPYSQNDLRKVAKQWKTATKVSQRIGNGISQHHYKGYVDGKFIGIIQKRAYLGIDEGCLLWFVNGDLNPSNNFSDIELDEIFNWIE